MKQFKKAIKIRGGKRIILERGKRYNVIHREFTVFGSVSGYVNHTADRIFKAFEERFGGIRCAVFTAKVRKDVVVTILPNKGLRLSGRQVPRTEVSIPGYDIVNIKEVRS